MSFKELKDRIKKNEGYSDKPYQDQLGFYTIGYGHLITEKENKYYIKKFKKKYFEELFEIDFKKAHELYKKNFFLNFLIKIFLFLMIFYLCQK